MKPISSEANATFRRWLRIATHPRAVREAGITLAEGAHLAEAALAGNATVEAALVRGRSDHSALLARLPAGTPVFQLAAALYDRLELVEHGIGLALVVAVPPDAAGMVDGDLLYLDGVQEPGNAGALLRVAAAAGVRQVWAGPGCAALWAPKVLRAAQGAHFRLSLRENVAPAELATAFAGTRVATAVHDGRSLWQTDLPAGPVAWLMGSEGQGLSAAALTVADLRVTVPLDGAVESLNVASAAAVCLFERRRRLPPG